MSEPDLYGLPLEEFTPARDAAAKEIRKAGDRETAARVAKLPKPSPAAWAANQVARTQPDLIEALLDAGASLRAAQDAAVAGGGSRALRDATVAERRAVEDVMNAATGLKPAGKKLSRAMADRLRTALHAAATDEAIRSALSAGRLVSEATAGGAWPFAVGDDVPLPSPKRKPKAKAKPKEVDEEAERAEREAAELRKALEAQLREARAALRVRERVAEGASEDADAAAEAIEDARERLEEAQAALQEAESEAEAAQHQLVESHEALDAARDDVARLEERLD
jgi:hypothetical protein